MRKEYINARRMLLRCLFTNERSSTILGQPCIEIVPVGRKGKAQGQE